MKDYFNTSLGGVSYYGMHMLATFEGLGEDLLFAEAVEQYLMGLADHIGMDRFGPPQVYRFGEGHEIGLSGFQLITTSAISLHTNDPHRDLYLDVFSCRDFDPDAVRAFTVAAFGKPDHFHHSVVLRR